MCINRVESIAFIRPLHVVTIMKLISIFPSTIGYLFLNDTEKYISISLKGENSYYSSDFQWTQ